MKIRMLTFVVLACSLVTATGTPVRLTESAAATGPAYNSWPMIQAMGTKLVCCYTRGKAHNICEGVRGVFARTSTDGGRTWSPEVTVVNDPGYGEVTIGKGLASDGALLLWVRCYGGRTPHHDL